MSLSEFHIALLLRSLLIIGGLNYLAVAAFQKSFLPFPKVASLLIGLAAVYLMMNRDFFLPFLGSTVIPTVNTNPKNSQTAKEVKIVNLPPSVNVVYWAAKPDSNIIKDPYAAYGNYENSGIAQTDTNGAVSLYIDCPAAYKVNKFKMFNKVIPKHVHYRYEIPGQNYVVC